MENPVNLEMTQEEATEFKALIADSLVKIKKANEQMALDQIEIQRLKAETAVILADIQHRAGTINVEAIL
ncbi:MAG TPA: hypothetical protein VGB07_25875 [Blastocatellia bacterium]